MTLVTRSLLLVLVSVVMSSVGQTLLKIGLDKSGAARVTGAFAFVATAFSSGFVWAGLVLFAGSVLVWMRVLSTSQLSWSYPLLGLSYVFVALLGWLVFGEHLSAGRLLGIGLVVLGAAFISMS